MSVAPGRPASSGWRRPVAAVVALGTLPDLLLGLAASVEALYYVALLMLVPLALCRLAIGAGALRVAWTAPPRAPRWTWAGQLAHSLLVVWVLRGRHADLLHGRDPGTYPDAALGIALAVWPYAIGLLAAWALVREVRDGRVDGAKP